MNRLRVPIAFRRMVLDRSPAVQRLRSAPRIALDRASLRRIDGDGHMHVASSVISSATVNPYGGNELVGIAGAGNLRTDAVYQILRDPAELAKGAASFNGKPLLISHRPLAADDHAPDLVVGTVNNPIWDPPNLKAELTIWDAKAIRVVQDGSQSCLSCGYMFVLDMTPGWFEGARYDGKMKSIRGNHVALVDVPRVANAMVGDAKGKLQMSESTATETYSNLLIFLTDKLSDDDLKDAIRIMGGMDTEKTPDPDADAPMAGDSARRAVAAQRQLMASAHRSTDDYATRFPNANRLNTRFR